MPVESLLISTGSTVMSSPICWNFFQAGQIGISVENPTQCSVSQECVVYKIELEYNVACIPKWWWYHSSMEKSCKVIAVIHDYGGFGSVPEHMSKFIQF